MPLIAWMVFAGAAILEVGGNASIHHGVKRNSFAWVTSGFIALGSYGLLVNQNKWDFSRRTGYSIRP